MSRKHIKYFDKHGFAVFKETYSGDAERCHKCYRGDGTEKHMTAWQTLLTDWDLSNTRLTRQTSVLMRKGVPMHLRGAVWKRLLETDRLRNRSKFNYNEELKAVRNQLVDQGISEYSGPDSIFHMCQMELDGYLPKIKGNITTDCLRQIFLDLDRSYPTHKHYMDGKAEGKEGRATLFRLLAVYARYNPTLGYCQGMSYIGGILLMYLNETDAFWCFASLLDNMKYISGYFDKNLERIRRHATVFYKLMKVRTPQICEHLEKLEIHPLMFIIPWFLSLFTGIMCWETVLIIWDLFMLEGIKALFRVGLALLQILEADLLQAKDLCHVLPILLHPDITMVHYTKVVNTIWNTHLEDWEISDMDDDMNIAETEALIAEQIMSKAKEAEKEFKPKDQNSSSEASSSSAESSMEVDTSPVKTAGAAGKTKQTSATGDGQVDENSPEEPTLLKRLMNMFNNTPQSKSTPKMSLREKRSASSNKNNNLSKNEEKNDSLTEAKDHFIGFIKGRPKRSSNRTSTAPTGGWKMEISSIINRIISRKKNGSHKTPVKRTPRKSIAVRTPASRMKLGTPSRAMVTPVGTTIIPTPRRSKVMTPTRHGVVSAAKRSTASRSNTPVGRRSINFSAKTPKGNQVAKGAPHVSKSKETPTNKIGAKKMANGKLNARQTPKGQNHSAKKGTPSKLPRLQASSKSLVNPSPSSKKTPLRSTSSKIPVATPPVNGKATPTVNGKATPIQASVKELKRTNKTPLNNKENKLETTTPKQASPYERSFKESSPSTEVLSPGENRITPRRITPRRSPSSSLVNVSRAKTSKKHSGIPFRGPGIATPLSVIRKRAALQEVNQQQSKLASRERIVNKQLEVLKTDLSPRRSPRLHKQLAN